MEAFPALQNNYSSFGPTVSFTRILGVGRRPATRNRLTGLGQIFFVMNKNRVQAYPVQAGPTLQVDLDMITIVGQCCFYLLQGRL